MYSIPSAHILDSRPPCTYSGRAGNACTNLLGFLVWYVRTRGIAEAAESGKTADFRHATLSHALATHGSCDKLVHAAVVRKEDGASPPCWLLVLLVMQKYEKEKVTSCLFIKRLLIRHASRDTFCPCLGDAVQRWLRHPEPSSWSYKSTRRKKLHYDTSLSEFFSLVRKERKGQKEERIPLLISFCRLAATGANKVPWPSGNCWTTATGSKRSSADSDSLLCHVGLRRTSRFRFGCVSGCEHSEINVILIVPSAHLPYPRPRHPFFSGRADNACTNLLGYLVWYVRTRGIVEAVGSGKTTDFTFAPLPHALATHGSRD